MAIQQKGQQAKVLRKERLQKRQIQVIDFSIKICLTKKSLKIQKNLITMLKD